MGRTKKIIIASLAVAGLTAAASSVAGGAHVSATHFYGAKPAAVTATHFYGAKPAPQTHFYG